MDLYLLRHADADTDASSDYERYLSEKGISQARKVARFCKDQQFDIERILSSPVRRAHETAQIVSDWLNVELKIVPWLSCGMHPETALDELKSHRDCERILLTGHEPDLSQLAGHLLGVSGGGIHVRKASLTLIEALSLREAAGQLCFSIPCRFM